MGLSSFTNIGYSFKNCNGIKLRYDQACLEILTDNKISFWSQYEECEDCIMLKRVDLYKPEEIVIETFSPLRYSLRSDQGEICNGT